MRIHSEELTHEFRIQFINTHFVIYLDATTMAIVNSDSKFSFCFFFTETKKDASNTSSTLVKYNSSILDQIEKYVSNTKQITKKYETVTVQILLSFKAK